MSYAEIAARYEAMRQNNGEPAHQITREKFFDLLEVLPPAKWTRRHDTESFMVVECETANLYTWCARLGTGDDATYWQMVAPNDSTHSDILRNVALVQEADQ
jgi:hypothetical protein